MTQPLQPSNDNPPPVLAYATPVSRRQINKPLRTRIVYEPGEDGPAFSEVSDDKPQVIGATLFCSATMLAMGATWMTALTRWLRTDDPTMTSVVLVIGLLLLGQVGTILFVLNHAWRQTQLAIRDGVLVLRIAAPVGSRQRQWPLRDVLDVRAWVTAGANQGIEPLCELQVQARGEPVISLFRNYGQRELEWVSRTFMSVIIPEEPETGAGA